MSIPSMLGIVGIGLALDTFDAMVGMLIEPVFMTPKAEGIVVIVMDSIEATREVKSIFGEARG